VIPDLGPYAAEVALAYGVSLVLLLGLVALSWRRWRRLRDDIARAERDRRG
jgi:heme exporter protein D